MIVDLAKLLGRRVLVIGDLMLDEFVDGEVLRISPEAPVPVLEVTGRTHRPGGAANAAANVGSLGGRPALAGIVGADREGDILQRELRAGSVDLAAIVPDASRPTTHKMRIIARGQQVVRIDHESREPLAESVHGELVARCVRAMADHDACIISDYNKGVVSPALCNAVIQAAGGKPVVVDPKRRDFKAYRGATVVTPNLNELEAATGIAANTDDDVVAAGRSLLASLGGGAVLATRGARGMTLIVPDKAPLHLPATAREVFDVTGAGDTVVSTLGLALAAGVPLDVAVAVANQAAGIAVGKKGTATVFAHELQRVLG
ncbi:D-glycero-beta-D-manno-heptose-7-phosphate kinase [Pendulispora rubella]|uniref:D-glycero-beta-D-manno-heptose-7-phosphate kinase n=1 Tax=Pendulispora rubella TaxID=2741070 RepID=A0ABZ2L013_9BACT